MRLIKEPVISAEEHILKMIKNRLQKYDFIINTVKTETYGEK